MTTPKKILPDTDPELIDLDTQGELLHVTAHWAGGISVAYAVRLLAVDVSPPEPATGYPGAVTAHVGLADKIEICAGDTVDWSPIVLPDRDLRRLEDIAAGAIEDREATL